MGINTFFAEIKQTLFPSRDSKDGPLPPLLVAMTVNTGLVDSFSYLVLGHIFVANMTGNIVFLAFALAGAKGFSIASSILAIAAFLVGSFAGGSIGSRVGPHRGHLLRIATTTQVLLVAIALTIALVSGNPVPANYSYALIITLAISMGIQNSTARKLAVPDLTTTVLTLTMTGIAADSSIVRGSGSKIGRRLISISAMFVGAFVGALMILYVSIVYPLIVIVAMTSIIALLSRVLSRDSPLWDNPK